jgi:hypothetical protein
MVEEVNLIKIYYKHIYKRHNENPLNNYILVKNIKKKRERERERESQYKA